VLKLVEEAFDDITLLVEFCVVRALKGAIALRRDDDLTAGFGDLLAEMIRVIAFVGDRDFGSETFG
jgi:hypothetical protein